MRAMLVAIALVVAVPAAAQRPSTKAMSCEQAQALVSSRGAVVMSTGPSTYKRFVATVAFCTHGELTEPAWATVSDGSRCKVGYECVTRFPRLRR